MSEEPLFRFRLEYSKTAAVRYISHLDLQRTWERAFRRAALPLAFTSGFHPHPRLNLGLALALGWTSEVELLDVWLVEEMDPQELASRLQRALPPALPVASVTLLPLRSPKLQQQIQAVCYEVQVGEAGLPAEMPARISSFLAADTMLRTRRGKQYDLRPLVQDLSLQEEKSGEVLHMTLSALPSATGRPDEVLDALAIDPLAVDIHRSRLILAAD